MNRAEKFTKSAQLLNASSIKKNLLLAISAVAVASLLLAAVVTGDSHAYRPDTVSTIHGTLARTNSTSPEKSRIAEAYGKLPLRFEANRGETDKRVKFIARGSRYTLLLTPNEADLALSKTSAKAKPRDAIRDRASQQAAASTTVLRIRLAGGNSQARITAGNELPGKTNYLIGSDSSKWLTNVPSYARVQAHDVYPGIDVAYYGKGMEMEEDFVVAPGGDPKAIALDVAGAKKVSINPQGELVLASADGDLYLRKPTVYQTIAGARREIQGRYQLRGENRVGFEVGQYDASQPLVIDPVLSYSTYLGGSGFDGAEEGGGIAVDSLGNAYVTGYTASTNFPVTLGSFQHTFGGSGAIFAGDAFIAELNPAGTALVYCTYLGGSDGDFGIGIAVDSSGNAYVTGATASTNFPVTFGSFQTTFGGGGPQHGFVAKLNPFGTALVYSTYLGGNSGDYGNGIAVDSSGSAYVTGFTDSTNFPGTSSSLIQHALHGFNDAFVTKINPGGTALMYSTYLGGTSQEIPGSIAVDSSGSAYVTGTTYSTDFPVTPGSIQTTFGGGSDAFVAKLNPLGTALVYSTYLGGSSYDLGYGIAVDSSGNAYVAGDTESINFTGAGSSPIQSSLSGSDDAFVAKLNATGTALVYSTYLGGSGADGAVGIALDSSGNAYVTGITFSTDFPGASLSAIQPTNGGAGDAFVAEINGTGTSLIYSTYLGGSGYDVGDGIAVDSSGNIYVFGRTFSANFPGASSSSIQPTYGGAGDAFVAKIGVPLTPAQATQALINTLQGLGLPAGTQNALTASLQAALASIARGNNTAAINQLGAFINKVQADAKTGKITAAVADQLIASANAIISTL
jgi:Beta-propeller repeat